MPDYLIDTTDVQDHAHITDWSGIYSDGPARGDLVELDGLPGAVWLPGEAGTYSYEVPVTMLSHTHDEALGQLRTLQALKGVQRTFTRTLLVDGDTVTETHEGVIISAIRVSNDLRVRSKIDAVLIVQNLDGFWSGAGS